MYEPEDYSQQPKIENNMQTPRGKQILQRAEKQLADACIRSINNTIEVCT